MKTVLKVLIIILMCMTGLLSLLMFIIKFNSSGVFFLIFTLFLIIPLIFLKDSKQDKYKYNLQSTYKYCVSGNYLDGLPSVIQNTNCVIGINPDINHLNIHTFSKVCQNFSINLSQITNAGIKTESEVIEQNKSVIGRGIVGGLLFGSLGAIIGGMSGTGTVKRYRNHRYLIINYRNSSGELSVISFQIPICVGLNNLINYLCGYINQNANNRNIPL